MHDYENEEFFKGRHAAGLAVRETQRVHDERGVEGGLGEHEAEIADEEQDSKVLLSKGGRQLARGLRHT